MNTALKWLLGLLLALALLLMAALGAGAWWLSGEGPRHRAELLASERLGVPVTLGKLSLAVFPLPALSLQDLVISTEPPLKAQSIELRPQWRSLLGLEGQARQLVVSSLMLQGVSLPQRGLDQLQNKLQTQLQIQKQQSLSKSEQAKQVSSRPTAQKDSQNDSEAAPAIAVGLLAIPQQTVLDGVTWQSNAGEAIKLSGRVRMSDARDVAEIDLQLAGGSVRGSLRLQGLSQDLTRELSRGKATAVSLRGDIATTGVDLAALPGLRARLGGRLQANTALEASAAQWSGLSNALQTRTQFNVSSAMLKGIDLAKAVRTLGISRGGDTALEQLSGNLSTRGSGAPMQLSLTDLQAKSKLLSASGQVAVGPAANAGAPRALSGKLSVDLTAGGGGVGQAVGQLVGIPLEISGTTAAPTVMPTRGAMIGGAIGSVMAPVIGTGAGAKMGDKAAQKLGNLKERLFGK